MDFLTILLTAFFGIYPAFFLENLHCLISLLFTINHLHFIVN